MASTTITPSSSASAPAEARRRDIFSFSQSCGIFNPGLIMPPSLQSRRNLVSNASNSIRIVAVANSTPSSSRAKREPESSASSSSSSAVYRKRISSDPNANGTPWRKERDTAKPKETSFVKKENVNRYSRSDRTLMKDNNVGKKDIYSTSKFPKSPRISNQFRDGETIGFNKFSLLEEEEEDFMVKSRINVELHGNSRRDRTISGADSMGSNFRSEEQLFENGDAEFSKETNVEDVTDSLPSHITQTRFDSFDISPLSIKALHSILKYERMTEVQEAAFPAILQGKDVLAKARTGTGKTIAFLLPAIEAILKAPAAKPGNPICILVVCPTRELAQQAATEAQVLLTFHKTFGAQVVYGGTSMPKEQLNLRKNPCQILVGTPGRLVDHIQNTSGFANQLKYVKLFILDEADHMLDMGFRQSLEKIMQVLPSRRQSLLFSATIPKEVHNIAKIALRDDYLFIDAVGKDNEDTHSKVKQQFMMVPLEKQLVVIYETLKNHMKSDPQYKVLVFCTTARVTAFMCSLFTNLGFNSREIHSRKQQNYRTRVSDEFRHSQGGLILFTSDVSARGVDYPNVTLVVQVGAPSDLQQYIHRLGRTGRAGKDGEGLLILAPWESYFLKSFQKLPVTELLLPKLEPQTTDKILRTAAQMDLKSRETAYQAWLGYYKSLKGITLEKVELVRYANQFSASMGFKEPPALSKMLIGKMSLKGVPGIRCA